MAILIKNGTIIDGTGKKGFKSDILIKGDIISEVGTNLNLEGAQVIDATNKTVSPGFIDMHSHGDLNILRVNKAEATIMQGVTTLVVAVCGLGLAPANEKVRDYYSIFVTKVFSSSEVELYDTFQDFFKAIEEKGTSTNLAFFIPQGNIRTCILGIEDRDPTQEELEEMKQLVKQGMEAGAFGLSTGLIYPPGIITPTKELIELSKVVSEYDGIYDSHMRNEGTGILEKGMGELIKIAREANVENFKENLTNPEIRAKIVEETLELAYNNFLSDVPWYVKMIPKFLMKKIIFQVFKKSCRIISVMYEHQVEGKFLGEALDILYPGKKFEDALLDFVRDEEGSIMMSMKQMSEKKSILELIKQEFVCIGSDGFLVPSGNTHPRSSGTFPRILGNYVREKKLFSLEEGVRKMTGLTASILRLKDRGLINEGYKADLVIFDPETIIDKSTYSDGRQYPEGIDYVIVNGEITVSDGKHLGTLSGRILKH